jgi:hypothetical protein
MKTVVHFQWQLRIAADRGRVQRNPLHTVTRGPLVALPPALAAQLFGMAPTVRILMV